MKLSDSTSISLPARNLLAILAAVAIGTMSYFSVIERLNKIETTLQLMEKDLEAANTFIDSVPKGCLLYTSPSPRDGLLSRMPSSA